MIYKLTSTRVYRSYYGGQNIDTITGVEQPVLSRFPEDWLASVTTAFNPDRPIEGEGLSRTEDGRCLRDIITENKEQMLGYDKEMKLLFKLLDAAERLVIQGHPTIPFAKEYFHSPFGKTECWYMLNDGGTIYLGFQSGITKEYWKKLFEKQDTEGMLKCLHQFTVRRGDMVFVEGGVPHAIGAGCFMAELQEPTDLMVVTERVTPSGVVLPEKKLHGGLGFERMFDCFHYEGLKREEVQERFFLKPKEMEDGRTLLVGRDVTDKFQLEKMQIEGHRVFTIKRYGIVLVISGNGRINDCAATAGDRFFVPEDVKEVGCLGKLEFLFCSAV